MGLLNDRHYWAKVAVEISRHRPVPKDPMHYADAIAVSKIGCRALSDLVKDKEFHADVDAAVELAKRAQDRRKSSPLSELGPFLDEFMRAEKEVLLQSGVDMDTTLDLLRELRELALDASTGNEERLRRLADRITFCAEVVCKTHRQLEKKELEEISTVREVFQATRGIAVIGIDLGSIAWVTAAGSPIAAAIGGTILGLSVEAGAQGVWQALKRHF